MPQKEEVSAYPGKTEIAQLQPRKEVSFWLDGYDDIFSDFDPRLYHAKGFSVDFLEEAKRAFRELPPEPFVFRLLIPSDKRRPLEEAIIRKRLRDHAKKHYTLLKKEQKKIKQKGIALSAVGMVLIGLATFVAYHSDGGANLLFSVLQVLFEPAGWFSVWFGLEIIFRERHEKKPDYEFYHTLTKADLKFESY